MIKNFLLSFVFCSFFINTVLAAKWYVDDAYNVDDAYTSLSIAGNDANSGSSIDPLATLDEALTLAAAFDTIYIDAGTYSLTTEVNVNKSITIIGASTLTTFLDGANSAIHCFLMNDNIVFSIQHITITHFGEDAISYHPTTGGSITTYIDHIKVTRNIKHGLYYFGFGKIPYFKCTNSEFSYNGTTPPYRGIYTSGMTVDTAIVENCDFDHNGFVGVDFNFPNQNIPSDENTYARIVNCNIFTHPAPAIALVGFRSGLVSNNLIIDAGISSIELKTCAGNGMASGPGSLVISNNRLSQSFPDIDTRDIAGIAAINRDQNIAGAHGTLASSGIYIYNNEISGYMKLATKVTLPTYTPADTVVWSAFPYSNLPPDSLFDACGIIVEGNNHKIIGNKISNCELGVLIQERPTYSGNGSNWGGTLRPPLSAFFDATRCYPLSTAGTVTQRNGFFNCDIAIKGIGLTTILDASDSYLGQTTPAGAQSRVQTIPTHLPVPFPSVTPEPTPLASGVPTGMIDYTPWLKLSSDQPLIGFQGDLSYLVVDDDSPQAASKGILQEGHDDVQGGIFGLTVEISPGYYNEYNTVSKTLKYNGISTPLVKVLKMDGTNDILTVTGSFNIQDSLLLVDGLINTTSSTIITLEPTAVANVGTQTSFVNGPLNAQWAATSHASFNLPIGKATYGNRYMQFDFDKTTNTLDTYTAEYFPTGAPTLIHNKPVLPSWIAKSYWSLLPAIYADFNNPQMKLHYGLNDYDNVSNKQTILKDDNNVSGTWLNLRPVYPQFDVLSDSVIASSISQNANFTTLGKFVLAPVFNCDTFRPRITITQPTCSGIVNDDNGRINASHFSNAIDQYAYSTGTTYSGSATYNNGTQFIPANGSIADTVQSTAFVQNYTLRFFNDYGCIADTAIHFIALDCSVLPVVGIAKEATTITYPTDSTSEITYNLYVKNIGIDTAFNVIVTDSLRATLHTTNFTITSISSTGYLTLNSAFDGNVHDTLTTAGIILPPHTQDTISFTVSFLHYNNAGPYVNTAFVVADGVAVDSSATGKYPDGDNDGNPYETVDDQPTVVYLVLPPVAIPDVVSTNEDVAVNVIAAANNGATVLSNDSDPNGNNTISAPTVIISGILVPHHGSVDANGLYIPVLNYHGVDTVYYSICDNTSPIALCDTSYIVITILPVNDPPVAILDTVSLFSGETVSINMNANNSDVDNNLDITSTTLISNPNHGIASVNSITGVVTYTADVNYVGTDTLIVSVCDLGMPIYCTNDTLFINIKQPPLPPVAMPDVVSTNEDIPVNVITVANVGATVLSNDSDPNGNNTISAPTVITNGILAPHHGSVDVNGLYTPVLNYHGVDTVYYSICDNTSPIALCDTSYIVITILPVNDPPVAILDTVSLFSGETIIINMNANNSDVDNNLDITTTVIISGPNHGTASVNPTTSVVTYTADPNYFGPDTVIISVCDLGMPVYCTNDTLLINIKQPDSAPVATDDVVNMLEDGTITITALANDYDNNTNDSIVITQIGQPQHGTATLNSDGTITYVPAANYNGMDTIHYTVCSGAPQQCSSAVIIITVNPVNDAPVVINNQATTTINTAVSGNINTNNNDDIDGTVVTVYNINVVQAPSNGTITMTNIGDYTYTPNNGFTGIDTVVYQVCDNGIPLPTICMNDTLFINVLPATTAILGLAKSASTPVLQTDGSYTIAYTFIAKNYSSTATISTIQITDDLKNTFVSPSTFNVLSVQAKNNSTLIPNNQYNGSTIVDLLNASLSVLAPLASDTIVMTVKLFLNNTATTVFNNIAVATGTNTLTNLAVQDSSNSGVNPLTTGSTDPTIHINNKPTTITIVGNAIIGVAKEASEPLFNESDGSFSVNYTITVKNYGNTTLTGVQVYENLNKTFPLPVSYAIKSGSLVTTGGLNANTNFASSAADTLLLTGTNTLLAGQQASITFTVIIQLNSSTQTVFKNSVIASAQNNQGQVTSDVSTNGSNPNPINSLANNPSESGEDIPTPIVLVPTDVIVPTGFSPDGDGVNDFFVIKGIESFPNNELQIFNRWGNKVYNVANYQNTWNATCNASTCVGGDKVQPGTYYFIVDLKNNQTPKTGYLEIRY